MKQLAALAAGAALCSAAPWQPFPDGTLNFTQIAVSQPESSQIYLGSPSVVRLPSGILVASHDFFGHGAAPHDQAVSYSSADDGATWQPQGNVSSMYWATLFTVPGDANPNRVYLLGNGDDGAQGKPTPITIARSDDAGAHWTAAATLFVDSFSYSTGPTPVMAWAGRLWRAFEHNVGPGWASGYSSLVISAPLDAPDLLAPSAWSISGELPFNATPVPSEWNTSAAALGVSGGPYGWLEGGVVEPPNASDTGVLVMLRVNSLPKANVAALLRLDSPTAVPRFVQWVDPFPGGMTKFSVRRDSVTGLYVTLANNASEGVTLPPTCGAVAVPDKLLRCCGFIESCAPGGQATCQWCQAIGRNVLTLSVAPAPGGPWTIVETVMADDTGIPAFISLAITGFQYVDWQYDNDDIIAAVRTAYRGGNVFHNSNRITYKVISNWRSLVPPSVLAAAAAARGGAQL